MTSISARIPDEDAEDLHMTVELYEKAYELIEEQADDRERQDVHIEDYLI